MVEPATCVECDVHTSRQDGINRFQRGSSRQCRGLVDSCRDRVIPPIAEAVPVLSLEVIASTERLHRFDVVPAVEGHQLLRCRLPWLNHDGAGSLEYAIGGQEFVDKPQSYRLQDMAISQDVPSQVFAIHEPGGGHQQRAAERWRRAANRWMNNAPRTPTNRDPRTVPMSSLTRIAALSACRRQDGYGNGKGEASDRVILRGAVHRLLIRLESVNIENHGLSHESLGNRRPDCHVL